MLTVFRPIVRLLQDRRGAAAAIVAVILPVLLAGVAFAVETALIDVRKAELQAAADAASGAAREMVVSSDPDPKSAPQQKPITEAIRLALLNRFTITAADVEQGWWDITQRDPMKRFGGPNQGQTGLFSNAVRVTAHEDHPLILGALLGKSHIPLTASAIAYKCSNFDYPLTRIADDVPSQANPMLWFSWATPGHDKDTSYYYDNPTNKYRNPVFKFYSPTDGDDVSFVVEYPDGKHFIIQADTYCKGTYLVIPGNYDWKQSGPSIVGTLKRGSTNNSFAEKPHQEKYPFQSPTTTYYFDAQHHVPIATQFLDPTKTHTTRYPNANGYADWASESTPTPDRRSLLVR